MKLLVLMVLGLALAEAKPKKQERSHDANCTDALPEEACQMIALNRGCIENNAAQNCRKTCKLCHGCEDTSSYYCQTEKANGLLDCSRGDHADYCQKTCGKCSSEPSAPKTDNKAGARKLRQNKRGCEDTDSHYCRTKKAEGLLDCSLVDYGDYCQKTCGKCSSEPSTSKTDNEAGARKLRRNQRGEDDCTDDEDAEFCSNMLLKGHCSQHMYKVRASKCAKTCGLCFACEDISSHCGTTDIDVCGQEDLEHFCLKSCEKCSERSLAGAWTTRAKRALRDMEAEDPLAHLLRKKEDCNDISRLCHELPDGLVCSHESLQFCLKTCNKCDAHSMERGLEMTAQFLVDHPDVKDPLEFLIRRHTGPKKSKRKEKVCKDESLYCQKFLDNAATTINICEHNETLAYCLKSCNKCNQRSLLTRTSMTAEDPMMHLVRQELCVDKNVVHCMKVANDNYCGKEDLALECPKTCGLCGSKKKRSQRTLLKLDGACVDDVAHCEEIKQKGLCDNFETNHICKLTCRLCKP